MEFSRHGSAGGRRGALCGIKELRAVCVRYQLVEEVPPNVQLETRPASKPVPASARTRTPAQSSVAARLPLPRSTAISAGVSARDSVDRALRARAMLPKYAEVCGTSASTAAVASRTAELITPRPLCRSCRIPLSFVFRSEVQKHPLYSCMDAQAAPDRLQRLAGSRPKPPS